VSVVAQCFFIIGEIKNWKNLEKSDFGGCQFGQKLGKKKRKKIAKFLYLVLISLCSQKYRRMILVYF
jgi:hypothetical protein